MKNRQILTSRHRAIAWGRYLVETFRRLHISGNKVIRNCRIGRQTYYRMKEGKQVNADAYLRTTSFALQTIRERDTGRYPPPVIEEEWKKQCWKIIAEEYASGNTKEDFPEPES